MVTIDLFFWILMDTSLPKFDIYQGRGATNYFKSHNSLCAHFFQEKNLFDVQPEIHLVWRNIVSTRQSVWAQKNQIQAWDNHMSMRKWTVADGVHHWRILKGSYRKLVWEGFEPAKIEFNSHAKADCVIYIYIYIYFINSYIYIYII